MWGGRGEGRGVTGCWGDGVGFRGGVTVLGCWGDGDRCNGGWLGNQ